jgi:DNA repair exonuclease SbcCD ATPase subunit
MGTIEESVDKNLGKMETHLKRWASKLDEIVDQAEKNGDQAKFEARQRIEAMREKLADAQSKLAELERIESSNWDRFKADLHVAWLDLEAAFEELIRPPQPKHG